MKTCSKCDYENSDSHRFCMKCGTPLDNNNSQELDTNTLGNEKLQWEQTQIAERFFLLGENLAPAEGEAEVRSYHCTSFKSALLNLTAEGHLVVTNKRVVFHASGKSFAGKSILQSEVPIEDVSGISIYKGSYLSILHILGAFFFSTIVGGIANSVVLGIIYLSLRSYFDNPNGSNINIDSLQTTIQVVLWLLALGCLAGSFLLSKKKIFRSALVSTSAMMFAELGGLSLLTSLYLSYIGGEIKNNQWILILSIIAGLYAAVCIFWYARRPTMSLAVGSKGGSSTPIAISGISSIGIYNTAASKALSAEPAEDAEALLKELGAMIMDIQVLGDLGIKRWNSGTVSRSAKPETEQG